MNQAYDSSFNPPVPVLDVRLAGPGEMPGKQSLSAVVDTGADGTLVPTNYLVVLAFPKGKPDA